MTYITLHRMTASQDVVRTLEAAAHKAGLSFQQTRQPIYIVVWIDGMPFLIPANKEITETVLKNIYKEAAVKLGRNWWHKMGR